MRQSDVWSPAEAAKKGGAMDNLCRETQSSFARGIMVVYPTLPSPATEPTRRPSKFRSASRFVAYSVSSLGLHAALYCGTCKGSRRVREGNHRTSQGLALLSHPSEAADGETGVALKIRTRPFANRWSTRPFEHEISPDIDGNTIRMDVRANGAVSTPRCNDSLTPFMHE